MEQQQITKNNKENNFFLSFKFARQDSSSSEAPKTPTPGSSSSIWGFFASAKEKVSAKT